MRKLNKGIEGVMIQRNISYSSIQDSWCDIAGYFKTDFQVKDNTGAIGKFISENMRSYLVKRRMQDSKIHLSFWSRAAWLRTPLEIHTRKVARVFMPNWESLEARLWVEKSVKVQILRKTRKNMSILEHFWLHSEFSVAFVMWKCWPSESLARELMF